MDVALLVALAIAFLTNDSSFDPDFVVHATAGIALLPLLAVHLAGSIGWLRRVWRTRFRDRQAGMVGVNLVLAFATVSCVGSGFPVWLEWSDSAVIGQVHAATGFICLGATVAHLGLNRRRIARLAGLGA